MYGTSCRFRFSPAARSTACRCYVGVARHVTGRHGPAVQPTLQSWRRRTSKILRVSSGEGASSMVSATTFSSVADSKTTPGARRAASRTSQRGRLSAYATPADRKVTVSRAPAQVISVLRRARGGRCCRTVSVRSTGCSCLLWRGSKQQSSSSAGWRRYYSGSRY